MGNFFNNLNARLQSFMMGRNGGDKLATVCLVAAIILCAISIFFPNFVFTILIWALLIYAIFRCLSTNVAARQAEVDKFESIFSRSKGGTGTRNKNKNSNKNSNRNSNKGAGASGAKRARKTSDNKLYFSCEQCGQKLSVPRNKGTLKITCPKCHHQQKVKS